MMRHELQKRAFLVVTSLILTITFSGLPFLPVAHAQSIPAKLTDEEFWKLSAESSEPDGTFRSDNLLSNEIWFQYVLADLTKVSKPGRIYLGVGPEQNFTYIAATKPKMVFIIDIRRGNLDLQVMYKALFELSKDRAEFVSRLFSKKRPEGLTAQSTVLEIFAAYTKVETSEAVYNENLKAIYDHLTKTHGFSLSREDLSGVEHVLANFYQFGPDINYNSSGGGNGGGNNRVSYADLMTATDENGQYRSYLATEENFLFLKDLEIKNLVVPVVGDFQGPKAIRAVSAYLKSIDATVSSFYLSNVEDYLQGMTFCRNAATLPLDETSTFIRSSRGGGGFNGGGLNSQLGNMMSQLSGCFPNGQ